MIFLGAIVIVCRVKWRLLLGYRLKTRSFVLYCQLQADWGGEDTACILLTAQK
jgi:hypothetical protein